MLDILIENCTGYVLWFSEEKGFGYIRPSPETLKKVMEIDSSIFVPTDIFFHWTSIKSCNHGYYRVRKNCAVLFSLRIRENCNQKSSIDNKLNFSALSIHKEHKDGRFSAAV